MKDILNIALIQANLLWENTQGNLNYFDKKIESISSDIDLVVLPEMFSTGFSMNPTSLFETMDGVSISWMQKTALKRQLAVVGSLIIKEGDNYYNRLIFVYPNGEIHTYDKRHLFTYGGEDKVYSSGNERLTVEYKGWKICPMICYDLRFPVWSRNTQDYDLLIYAANWPKPRISAWDTLLKARAIENMSYVVGVNRCGEDSKGNVYPGHSAIYDSLGNCISGDLSSLTKNISAFINYQELQEHRKKLSFLEDRDNFDLC